MRMLFAAFVSIETDSISVNLNKYVELIASHFN